MEVMAQIWKQNVLLFGDSYGLVPVISRQDLGLWGFKNPYWSLNNKATLNPGMLSYWIERIHALKRSFSTISFTHVYREKNNEADRLSKKGLEGVFGEMHYESINSNGIGASGKINIIWNREYLIMLAW